MTLTKKLDAIPRGNTVPGVNRTIIEYLLSLKTDFAGDVFFDAPCGEGDFLQTVKDFFPQAKTVGADVNFPSESFSHEFLPINAQKSLPLRLENKARIITCISGVMEFDNTTLFFERLRENLDEKGLFIVTNDNLLAVRDRILYLLFGRFRQYKLFIGDDQPTWKTLSLHNLLRILHESGFEQIEIRYVPVKTAERLWLPFALLIYVLQNLYLRFAEPKTSYSRKISLYPFASLLARHYVVVCRIKI